MNVELLYFNGCSNRAPARRLIDDVLADAEVPAVVREIEIVDAADAIQNAFLGSPTVRVDGVDIEPAAKDRRDFGMMCRVYTNGRTRSGVPPRGQIELAVQRALAEADGRR